MMDVTLHFNPHWSVLEETAISEWDKASRRGDMPLVIVPSSTMRARWLSLISSKVGGACGNFVVNLDAFAHQIAVKRSDRLGRLASPLERHLSARQAIAMTHSLPKTWQKGGIIDAFCEVVEELELHGLTPEQVEVTFQGDQRVNNLVNAFKLWKEQLHLKGLWSIGDVLSVAIDLLKSFPDLIPSYNCVLLYGFNSITDLRWDFLVQLLQSFQQRGQTSVRLFIPFLSDNHPACRYAVPFVKQLQQQFAAIYQPLPCGLPNELQVISQRLFLWQKPCEPLQTTDRITSIITAGEEQEVETVLRWLIRWRREGKMNRYSDALLIVRSLDNYSSTIEAISARYGVPFSFVGNYGFLSVGLRNFLWSIATACERGWDGESLWQVLPSRYLSVKSGLPLLPPEWHSDVLTFIRKRLTETDAHRWGSLLKEILPHEICRPISEFLHLAGSLPLHAPVNEHAKAWSSLIHHFLTVHSEEEIANVQILRERLNHMQGWGVNLNITDFISLIADEHIPIPPRNQDTVLVGTINEARGIWSPVVAILGLTDQQFPSSPSPFELLSDEHRQQLQKRWSLKTPLRYRRQLLYADRMLFWETVGSPTERLILSYPQTDPDGKPKSASVFISAVNNALKADKWIWYEDKRDLSDVLPCSLNEAIDNREAEILAIFSAFSTVKEQDWLPFASSLLRDLSFRHRLVLERLRWIQPQSGPWDGKGLIGLSEQIKQKLASQGLQVTALESYGRCPYLFFARHILDLHPPEEIAYSLNAKTIGTIWHQILQRFLTVWVNEQKIPTEYELNQTAKQVIVESAKSCPETVLEFLVDRVFSTLPKIWQAEIMEEKQWKPVSVEQALQLPIKVLGDIPPTLQDLQVHLRPDRVDVNKHRQDELRVLDYKTGASQTEKDITEGTSLQLPLYALAIQQTMGQVVTAHFIKLLSFTPKGQYTISCKLGQKSLNEAIVQAKKWAKQFFQRITTGDFTVLPFNLQQTCRNCEFKTLCRRHPLRLKERRFLTGYHFG